MYRFLPSNILENFKLFCLITNKKCYLPNEIKKLIYIIIIKSYYREVIYYNVIESNLFRYELKYYIRDLIYGEKLLNNYNIEILQSLSEIYIPGKYRQYLWANLLHVLSININRIRFYHIINNISFKSNEGKKLKLILNYWLTLCKQFNFKIFLQTKKTTQYIRAKNILNMNSYDKYIISPIVIKPFTNNIWIDYENAIQYLNNYNNTVLQDIRL